MKDIRINKNKISLNRIDLTFYKINFKFFSKILSKYKNNDYVNFLTSQKIPLTFFVKSNDNESILKSISEIIDILNKKEKQHYEKNDSDEEKDSQSITNINQKFLSYSQSNIDNTYDSPSLTYKYNSKNNKIVQALESVVDKIKKNIQSSKKKNREEKSLEKKENKTNYISKKQEIKSDKINLLEKNVKNEKNITKENISSVKKISSKDTKEDTEDLVIETFKKRRINSENIKKITSKFKKINEDIIRKNINSIKLNKTDYDFISNNKKISKNIYDKVSKTLFSIINKNNKIRHFSEISKNIVILDKTIRSNNIINRLNEVIKKKNLKYSANYFLNKYKNKREEEKIEKIHHYSKTANYKSLFNSISSFNSFISKNNFLSEESYNNLMKKNYEKKILDNYISKRNIKNKINYYKTRNNILYDKYKNKSEEEKIEKIHHYSKTADYKSLFNSISSFNSFISKNNFLSEESYDNLTKNIYKKKRLDKYISEKNIKNKINYYKTRNNILYDKYKNKREEEKIEKIHHYSKTADYKSLFNSISSFNSFISKNNFSDVITENLLNFKKNETLKSSKIFRSFLDISSIKRKKTHLNFLEKKYCFNEIISKYLNSYSKLKSNRFKFEKNNNFLFNKESNIIFDSIQNLNKKINKNNFESYVYLDKNIVYRNKIDIKKIINDSIEKIIDDKMQKKSKESPKFFNYNDKLSNIFQKFQKKEKPKSSPESITKKEVDQMIQSYIESINFQKISESAVTSVEDRIRMERYRNGLI